MSLIHLSLDDILQQPGRADFISLMTTFERRFKRSVCLPEMPPKTFFIWKEEGMIPSSFGKRKEVGNTSFSAVTDIKLNDNYNIYEFSWIRIVFYLRTLNYPKEKIIAASKKYFSISHGSGKKAGFGSDENLIKIIAHCSYVASNTTKRNTLYELDKLLNAATEMLFTTEYHSSIYQALTTNMDLYFVINGDNFSCYLEDYGSFTHATNHIHESYEPVIVLKFSRIMGDIVRILDIGFFNNVFAIDGHKQHTINNWRNECVAKEANTKMDAIDNQFYKLLKQNS